MHVLQAYWPLSVRIDGAKLLSVPRFDQVVIAINGGMALMRTVHPLDFACIERQLPEDLRRDPLKKTKDMAQTELLEQLVRESLPRVARLFG